MATAGAGGGRLAQGPQAHGAANRGWSLGSKVESCDEYSKSKVSINDYQLRELGLVPAGIIGVGQQFSSQLWELGAG